MRKATEAIIAASHAPWLDGFCSGKGITGPVPSVGVSPTDTTCSTDTTTEGVVWSMIVQNLIQISSATSKWIELDSSRWGWLLPIRKSTKPNPVESTQATSIWVLNLLCGEEDHFRIPTAASMLGKIHVAYDGWIWYGHVSTTSCHSPTSLPAARFLSISTRVLSLKRRDEQ